MVLWALGADQVFNEARETEITWASLNFLSPSPSDL
jgi:hypothetical protein